MEDEPLALFKENCRAATPEQKLALLRTEIIEPLATIRGYAHMLRHRVDPSVVHGLPAEFGEALDAVIASADRLREILDVATSRRG